ncbi:carcinoembryonic antigen-related cell adhesion molecule 5-like isoform X3 [Dysidea avara]|uniref:carcinoembryonic antigen-related cell adhesion molecule 5-like isoform X3 n=1 Tax=Dysidea avara TaxID=196820 RepID=UPI003330BB4F
MIRQFLVIWLIGASCIWDIHNFAVFAAYEAETEHAENVLGAVGSLSDHTVIHHDEDENSSGTGSGSVSEAPCITLNPSDQMISVVNGSEEVMLTCEGFHIDSGYWVRLDEGPLPNENNESFVCHDMDKLILELIITKPHPNHSGLYRCVVYSQWGRAESSTAHVNITVAPPVITKQPTNKTVDVLQSVIFGCEAVGFEVRYEWRRHSSSSMFGNESILTISKVTPFDEDFYYCVAITDGGLVVSDAALLTVNYNIIIAMQPRNIMASSGSNITLSVTALGVKLKYHWKKRGHDSLPSTAAGRYTAHFNITTVTPADSGLYYCVIKNQWGAKLHSDDAILNVLDIILQPESVEVAVGQHVTLTCNVHGVDNLTYYWIIEGQQNVIPETNNNMLNIRNVSVNDTGEYICVVIDGDSSVNSQPVRVTILALPVFSINPDDNGPITIAEGSDVTLRCEATGEGALNYQWRRLSGSLPDDVQGSNTTNLTIPILNVTDSGQYYCVVDNGGTGVPSSRVYITVKKPPMIVISPHNQAFTIITGAEKVVLTCEVGGDDIINGSWERVNEGQLEHSNFIQDQNIVQLTIYEAHPSDSGEYFCVVHSQWGIAQSNVVQVNITIVPPWITVQPTNKTVSLLDNFTISCEGEGFGVKYEWRRHNGSIRSASINQTSLTISQVLPSDEDQYYCIATTEGGVNISQIATLTVNALQLYPLNLTVAEGSDVQLNCSIETKNVSWHIENQDASYTITSNSSLMNFSNVSETHSGHYQCSVNVSEEEIKSNWVTLTVFELIDQLNNTIATLGSEVELRCSASVATSINCTWKHNDIAMNTNHSDQTSLMLHNVSLTDGGWYTCEIIGNAGKPVTSTAKLELLYVGIAPQNCSVVVGSSANVTCLPSILSSSLTYQWLHNGTIVKNETTAVLNLTNVKETDSGAYQCIVTISDTNATSNGAQFHVLYKPVSTSSHDISKTSIIGGTVGLVTLIVLFISTGMSMQYFNMMDNRY